MMVTKFEDNSHIIKTFVTSTKLLKLVKEQIEICKKALATSDVSLNVPIYEDYGVKEVVKRSRIVNKEIAVKELGMDKVMELATLPISNTEKFIQEKLENGEIDEDRYAEMMEMFEEDETKNVSYFQIQKFGEKTNK